MMAYSIARRTPAITRSTCRYDGTLWSRHLCAMRRILGSLSLLKSSRASATSSSMCEGDPSQSVCRTCCRTFCAGSSICHGEDATPKLVNVVLDAARTHLPEGPLADLRVLMVRQLDDDVDVRGVLAETHGFSPLELGGRRADVLGHFSSTVMWKKKRMISKCESWINVACCLLPVNMLIIWQCAGTGISSQLCPVYRVMPWNLYLNHWPRRSLVCRLIVPFNTGPVHLCVTKFAITQTKDVAKPSAGTTRAEEFNLNQSRFLHFLSISNTFSLIRHFSK